MTKYLAMELKPVNGCQIEKSFERNSRTGKIKPDTIVYSVYTNDGDDGLVGCLR